MPGSASTDPKVMHFFKGERLGIARRSTSRKLWRMKWTADLATRAPLACELREAISCGLHVGTLITEGTASFLVNRR